MKFSYRKGVRVAFTITFLLFNWISWGNCSYSPMKSDTDTSKAFIRNKNIGRGINFGNALEAPNEGEWGLVIKESYIQAVADAGFNSVRLPICWSAHTGQTYPYAIDAAFLNRVDEVMSWCLNRNLAVIITIHHFNDLYNYPDNFTYLNMFFAIWKQLTAHYISVDHDRLFFEVLNEPEVNLTADKWNLLMPQIIDTIRTKDSDRTLIIDGPDYAYHQSLTKLIIPESEQNIIVSTRYYLPYQFAQQGAWWSNWTDLNQYLGTTWRATSSEKTAVLNDMWMIKNWSETNKRPITIGEYGSIMFADNQSRVTWTNYVRTQFENNGFSWSYFDFGVVFKAYSIAENRWLDGFVDALTGNKETISDGRIADSISIKPANPTKNDHIGVKANITMPNLCTKTDSVKITLSGSVIKVKSYHTENYPQSNSTNNCTDSVSLGKYLPGDYTLIFDSEYVDAVNTLHYSVFDTLNIQIRNETGIRNNKASTIKVYPVPASEFIKTDNIKPGSSYSIYGLKGQLIKKGTVENGKISTFGLTPGEYVLEIRTGDYTVFNKQIVIMPY